MSLGCLGVSRAGGPYGWHRNPRVTPLPRVAAMDPGAGARKERPKPREPAARLEKAKQRSAQQELKQRQRAEVGAWEWGGTRPNPRPSPFCHPPFSQPQIYALNRVMTELEQQQFDSFCKQMQGSGE